MMNSPLKMLSIACVIMCSLGMGMPSVAEQIVSSGDGKKYRLNDDGSWELVSEDRFLDTADGRRVVLKTDGTWQYVGLTPKSEKAVFQSLALAAVIESIEIMETRKSAGGGKNSRISMQMHTSITLTLADTEKSSLDLSQLKASDFVIKDSRDKSYAVTNIQTSVQRLQPGESATLVLSSSKAPKRRSKIAELIVEVVPTALANDQLISVSYDYIRVKRTKDFK